MLGSSHSQQENDGSKPPDNVHEEDGYASRLPVYKRSESDMSSTSEASEVSLADAEKVDRDLGKVSGGSATKAARSQSQGGRGSNGSKRARTLLTPEQSRVLHELLQQTCFPSTQVREAVAAKLGLSPRKVQVFFQNKRQKQRKKSNGVPMSSHPLVVPMYPPNITSERLVDGPSASTKMGPPRLSPPAHPVAEPSAANVRERTTPMTTTAFNVRKPPLGPTVDPWVNNWHVRPTNTERRTSSLLLRPSSYDPHQPTTGPDTLSHSVHRHSPPTLADPYTPTGQPVSKEKDATAGSTVLPPILTRDEPKSSQLQLPSIDKLIAKEAAQ